MRETVGVAEISWCDDYKSDELITLTVKSCKQSNWRLRLWPVALNWQHPSVNWFVSGETCCFQQLHYLYDSLNNGVCRISFLPCIVTVHCCRMHHSKTKTSRLLVILHWVKYLEWMCLFCYISTIIWCSILFYKLYIYSH